MLSADATDVLASCTLALLGLTLVVWLVKRLRGSPYPPAQAVLDGLNRLMTRILWRTRVDGRLTIPPGQGAVIVCNHRSPVDPSFIALALDRLVHWMVAEEYCRHPAFGWFLRTCEVIPTNRGGIDTTATKQAIRYAQQGDLVGVFPEGRINATDRLMQSGRRGAAMIALKARVPLVPCYVSGSPYDGTPWGCLLMPAKVRLTIGDPIDISEYYDRDNDREVLKHLTRRLLKEIARLAGQGDFQPELAGRSYKRQPENG